jgi:hypothetical protein
MACPFVPALHCSVHSDLTVLIPVLHRGKSRDLFEYRAKGFCIGISHLEHHFIDVFLARLKAHLGNLHLHPLDIFHNGV